MSENRRSLHFHRDLILQVVKSKRNTPGRVMLCEDWVCVWCVCVSVCVEQKHSGVKVLCHI